VKSVKGGESVGAGGGIEHRVARMKGVCTDKKNKNSPRRRQGPVASCHDQICVDVYDFC